MSTSAEDLNNKLGANAGGTVLGHPAGLFILFFTEMWERFSFYGMRALLMFFLLAGITDMNPGWGWDRENAALLYMWYTSLVYLTPLIGGWIADRFLGFKSAVVIGALLVFLGQFAPGDFMQHLTVFVLAVFIGWQVIWNVAHSLHTPLMAVTNAISGIIVVGGLLQITDDLMSPMTILAFVAILVASINIVGGFVVTHRRLKMVKK